MQDHRTSSGLGATAHPDGTVPDTDVVKVSRREVLLGAASSVIASGASAAGKASHYLDVLYGDGARRSLMIAWVEGPKAADRHEWVLTSSTFAEVNGPGKGRFSLRRIAGGWRADLTGCSFPGGYGFNLRIDVRWGTAQPLPALEFRIESAGQTILLKQTDLIGFLKNDPRRALTPTVEPDEVKADSVTSSQLSQLVEKLFGPTFEITKAKRVALAFHRGGYWILRAGKRLGPNDVEPAIDATNRFSAMSNEGVALRFKEVVFSIFSGTAGGAGEAFRVQTDLLKEDVRALFSGDGAPPSLPDDIGNNAQRVLYGLVGHNTNARRLLGDAAGGDFGQTALLAGTPLSFVAPSDGYLNYLKTFVTATIGTGGTLAVSINGVTVAGMKATIADAAASGATQRVHPTTAQVSSTAVKKGDIIKVTPAKFATAGNVRISIELIAAAVKEDVWSGVIALGKAFEDETAAALELIDPKNPRPAYLAWRNVGNGNPVLVLHTPATLAIKRSSQALPTKFENLSTRVWRVLNENRAPKLVASLTPLDAPMRVRTRWGEFSTAPLPALSPRPGVKSRVPTIQVGGVGRKERRLLSHFVAPLALESAPINIGSDRLDKILKDAATLDPEQTALKNASYLFSQLTFTEAECIFRIKDVPLRHAWIGKPPPSTDPPQAEAIIQIGDIKDIAYPVRLSLNRATLLVRRPADLLALSYRFQDLVLDRTAKGWYVKPDRRLAAFVPSGQPTPAPTAPLICKDQSLTSDDPSRYQDRADPRPLLVVEFPPQHIAEQAFFRRLRPEPKLAVPPAGKEATLEEADVLRTGTPTERKAARIAVWDRQDPAVQPGSDFYKLRVAMKSLTNTNVPDDQKTYIGPAFLDLETARIARGFQRDIDNGLKYANSPEERLRLLRDVPEVELSPTVESELRASYGIVKNINENEPALPGEPENKIKWLKKRNDVKAQRDFTYNVFREFFKRGYAERAKTVGLTQDEVKAINDYQKPLPEFFGRKTLVVQIEKLSANEALDAAKAIAATVVSFDLLAETEEGLDAEPKDKKDALKIPAEARVSGGSRLVFRVPADDFEGGRPDNVDGAPAGAFPFTIEAFTNWGAFDLAVVRRAEKVFEPLAGWQSTDPGLAAAWPARPYGRLRPRWARQETRNEAAKLRHQGITRGDAWTIRSDEQRNLTGVTDCPAPLVRQGSVTAAQRMNEVVGRVREPTLFETSIEMPFRLILSPAQDAGWRTPLELPSDLQLMPPVRRIAPLWFAQLDELPGTSSVRAVWSPDFRPEALLDRDIGGPPHGPWAPWALSRDVSARFPYDEHEKDSTGAKAVPERFRTGLDAADRHELVALTSLHGLPVRGRRKTDGTLTDGSQIDPPPGFRLRHAEKEHLDEEGLDIPDDHSAIYRPQPLGVSELTLTALGGSFDADTNFVPPSSAMIVPTKSWMRNYKDPAGEPLFEALAIERWRQDTRLGRDIRSEVVYKGFLFPLGHRCSLVKLTERCFVAAPTNDGSLGHPVAFLIQRMFLRIGTPLKAFPAIGQPNGGRRWPMERLEILTRVTPDILDPADATPDGTPEFDDRSPSGRVYLREAENAPSVLPGMVFWPRVRPRAGGEVKFELQIDGRGSRTRLPLLFVDNTAANSKGTMLALSKYYNEYLANSDERRVLQLGGDKRRYAPETEPDGTSFETRSWVVEAEGREKMIPTISPERSFKFDNTNFDFGSLLQGADQPPFYPAKKLGRVRIAQVDRMLGQPSGEIDVFFDDEYQAFGFPKDDMLGKSIDDSAQSRRAKTDVYLGFKTAVSLNPGRNGERSGGPVRPNTQLIAMSRSRGPVGNNDAKPVTLLATLPDIPRSKGLDKPDPTKFFGDATLLGIVDLKQVLVFILDGIAGTPQFREVTQYTSALLADAEKDSAEAVAKVRDQLLVPLRDALIGLAREFYEQTVKGPGFDENAALERLARLYPDIASAYRDLAKALDTAIELSATAKQFDALIEHFATIYAAGRRFIAAIDRVAGDPLAPVREALREAFNTVIGELISAADQQLNLSGVAGAVDKLKAVATAIQSEFEKALVSAAFQAWRHLVLSLPGAHALPNTLAGQAKFVQDTVDAVLKDIPGDRLVKALAAGDLNAIAAFLGTEFDKRFAQKIKDAAAGPAQEALKVADQAWKAGAELETQAADRIRGLLFDSALPQIKPLLVAVTNLVSSLSPSPSVGAIAAALGEIVNAVREVLQPYLDFGQATAIRLCQDATAPFVKILQETLPLPAVNAFPQLEQARTAIDGALDDAITDISKLGLGLETIAQSLKKNIHDRLDALINIRESLNSAAAQVAILSGNVCSASPNRLQLDALATAKRARAAFISAVNQFPISVASMGADDVGGQLATLASRLAVTGAKGKDAREKLVLAIKEIVAQEARIVELMRDATSLRDVVTNPQKALSATKAALVLLKGSLPAGAPTARIDSLIAFIDANATAADNLFEAIKDARDKLDAQSKITVVDLAEEAFLQDVRALAKAAAETADKMISELVEAIEQRLTDKIAEFMLAGGPYLEALLTAGLGALRPVFGVLAEAQTNLVDSRQKIWTALGCTPAGSSFALNDKDPFGGDLSGITLRKVCDLLLVKIEPRTGLSMPAGQPPDNDYLVAERNQLVALPAALSAAIGTKQFDTVLKEIVELFTAWSSQKSSAELLATQLVAAATAVLSGDLKRIVDLEGVRRRIEEKLKELVPSRIALNYDMNCDLKEVGTFFKPDEGSQVTLAARATYDLLEPNTPPRFSATCEVDAFEINLFSVVTIGFASASFVNESGKGSDFHVAYRDFKLGPSAEFLKPLESLMNPGDNGPFVRPGKGFPGVEVGYVLDLGIISIGAMSFINVSITASCMLPFDNRPALFTASIGREDRPVLLSCLPYTGGGFLTLYANAKEMIGFAASFEFGGGGAFAFGPLTGQGRISTGIYLRKVGEDVTIQGFFYVGGEARIACFAIAASLVVRVSHQSPGGTMTGSAVFTYSFSIGFAKLRYSVGVQRTIGKGFSAGGAQLTLAKAHAAPSSPFVECVAFGLEEDWRAYQSYFSDMNGFPPA